MKFSKKISSVVFFAILCSLALAQEYKVISDFRLNTELEIEKSIAERWKLSFETTVKLEKDATLLDEIDFDLYADFKVFKFLNLGAGYRVAVNQKSDRSFALKHRFLADINIDKRIKRFELEYRIRYQNVDDDFFLYQEGNAPSNILRNRFLCRYDIRKSKITPYVFSELYGRLESYQPFPLKIKTGAGIRYNLKKYGLLKLYYRIDRELVVHVPYTYYTLGLGYSYDF